MELVPSGYAELGVGAVEVCGDRTRGQEQPIGDLTVGTALAGQVDDLSLLRGQLPQGIGRRGRAGDGYPAGPQFRLGALYPGPGTQPPERLKRRRQHGLGVVDAPPSPRPLAVVEAQLPSLERPLLPGGVRQRLVEVSPGAV